MSVTTLHYTLHLEAFCISLNDMMCLSNNFEFCQHYFVLAALVRYSNGTDDSGVR
jgi:hypothetical protein